MKCASCLKDEPPVCFTCFESDQMRQDTDIELLSVQIKALKQELIRTQNDVRRLTAQINMLRVRGIPI
jgi:uncharacterized coiled-coil protein SlyX